MVFGWSSWDEPSAFRCGFRAWHASLPQCCKRQRRQTGEHRMRRRLGNGKQSLNFRSRKCVCSWAIPRIEQSSLTDAPGWRSAHLAFGSQDGNGFISRRAPPEFPCWQHDRWVRSAPTAPGGVGGWLTSCSRSRQADAPCSRCGAGSSKIATADKEMAKRIREINDNF